MHKAAYNYLQLRTIIIFLLLAVQRIVRICYGDETCDILSYCANFVFVLWKMGRQ